MYIRTIGAVAVASLVAAGAYAQNVNTDSDPSAPFSTYKTYAWTPGTPSPVSLTEQRIRADVESQMSGKGMRLAQPNEAPDVYVATHVLATTQPELVANGFGPWGFGGYGAIDVKTLVKGTLVVDMYDAKTRKMVWRGVATATVSDKASKNSAKIDKALEKMFKRYPPSSN